MAQLCTRFEADWLADVKHLTPHNGLAVPIDMNEITKRAKSIIHNEFSSKLSLLRKIAIENLFAEKHPRIVWVTSTVTVEHSVEGEQSIFERAIYPEMFSE